METLVAFTATDDRRIEFWGALFLYDQILTHHTGSILSYTDPFVREIDWLRDQSARIDPWQAALFMSRMPKQSVAVGFYTLGFKFISSLIPHKLTESCTTAYKEVTEIRIEQNVSPD